MKRRMLLLAILFCALAIVTLVFGQNAKGEEEALWVINNVIENHDPNSDGYFILYVSSLEKGPRCEAIGPFGPWDKIVFLKHFRVRELKDLKDLKFYHDPFADEILKKITRDLRRCQEKQRREDEIEKKNNEVKKI